MKKAFALIKELSQDYNNSREQIKKIMLDLDSFILENFSKIDTSSKSLFKQTPEERLENLSNKLNIVNQTPNVAVQEAFKKAYDVMHTFVKQNALGFIEDFSLTGNLIHVKIICMITTSSFAITETPQMQKERQKRKLSKLNIDFSTDKTSGITIDNTNNNLQILKNLLATKSAKLINFSLLDDKIDYISFLIKPENLSNFMIEEQADIPQNINGLTEVDLFNINKCINDILYACTSYNTLGIAETCGYIIQSSFAELSKILNVETKVKMTFDNMNKEEKSIYKKIEEKEKLLSEKIDFIKMTDFSTDLISKIETSIGKNSGLTMSNIKINKHGTILFNLKRSSFHMFKMLTCSGKTLMPDEDFKKLFETIDTVETCYLLDTPNNKFKLEQILGETNNVEILNFVTTKENNQYIIKEIEAMITTIIE